MNRQEFILYNRRKQMRMREQNDALIQQQLLLNTGVITTIDGVWTQGMAVNADAYEASNWTLLGGAVIMNPATLGYETKGMSFLAGTNNNVAYTNIMASAGTAGPFLDKAFTEDQEFNMSMLIKTNSSAGYPVIRDQGSGMHYPYPDGAVGKGGGVYTFTGVKYGNGNTRLQFADFHEEDSVDISHISIWVTA